MITVNFSEGSPLYRQICRQIQQDIAQGHILPEEKLPSQRLLARHLGVSLNTVKLAYQQLTDEGYLVAVPRVGHFVDKLQPEMWPHEAKRERLPQEAVPLP